MQHQRLSHEVACLSEPEKRWVRQAIAIYAESGGTKFLGIDEDAKVPEASDNPIVTALIADTRIGEAHRTFVSARLFLWYVRLMRGWETNDEARDLAMHLVAKLCPAAGEILFNADQQQADETGSPAEPDPPPAEEPTKPH